MKMSNKNKFISGLLGVAMCPMMLPTAAFAADDGAASEDSLSQTELIQSSESEGTDTDASSGDTLGVQSESTGEAANATTSEVANEVAAPVAETGGESATAAVAEVKGSSYSSLQAAIDAAPRNATVKLLADTKENVTISANAIRSTLTAIPSTAAQVSASRRWRSTPSGLPFKILVRPRRAPLCVKIPRRIPAFLPTTLSISRARTAFCCSTAAL